MWNLSDVYQAYIIKFSSLACLKTQDIFEVVNGLHAAFKLCIESDNKEAESRQKQEEEKKKAEVF